MQDVIIPFESNTDENTNPEENQVELPQKDHQEQPNYKITASIKFLSGCNFK